jgi:hypothetical protein
MGNDEVIGNQGEQIKFLLNKLGVWGLMDAVLDDSIADASLRFVLGDEGWLEVLKLRSMERLRRAILDSRSLEKA